MAVRMMDTQTICPRYLVTLLLFMADLFLLWEIATNWIMLEDPLSLDRIIF